MSIRRVALEAGVSTATVSRVINNNGLVSDDTRKKILQAIDRLGYEPSLRQRRRANGSYPLKYNNFAMIWTSPPGAALSQTGQKMMLGIIEALKPLGAKLTIDHIDRPGYAPPLILEGKIDGILLHGPEPVPDTCNRLRAFPVVWLLQSGSTSFGDHVQPDHYHAGEIACKHLIQQGCRNLCCISYAPVLTPPPYWQTRALGFKTVAELRGIPFTMIEQPEQESGDMQSRQRAAEKAVARLKAMSLRPDGLFVSNDLCMLVHRELLNQGIVPMKDILFISGNDEYLNPQTVGIDIFDKQIGNLAVAALIWRIKNRSMPVVTYSIKPQLIVP